MAEVGIRISVDSGGLAQQLNSAASEIQNFGNRTTGAMRGAASETDSLMGSVDKFANGLKSAVMGSSIAVGLITLKNALAEMRQELIQNQIQLDKMRNGLSFAVGAGSAAAEMAFVRENARALGLELVSTTGQYTKLAAAARGTSLAGQGVRDVFTALTQASTVMGLSAQETEGALLAVTQMVSKNRVQAEELRGQLGERLPGAFQIAARAMGVTTAELDKLLETGQVVAEDFLPKFAAELANSVAPQVAEAANSMQASVNRMANSWTELKRIVNEGGVGKTIQNEMDGMANYMRTIMDAMENAGRSGQGGFGRTMAGLGEAISRMPFDALSTAANGVNFTLNTLSGGVLKLQTNLNYLPTVLDTNANKLKAMDDGIRSAQEQLDKLKNVSAQYPQDPYLKNQVIALEDYIDRLNKARMAKAQLYGAGDTSNRAEDARLSRAASQYAADQAANAKMRADLAAAKAKLSPGMDADYLKQLNALEAAKNAGVDKGGISDKEYVRLVTDLANKNYKAPEVKHDQNLDAMTNQLKMAKERVAVADEQARSNDKLTESERSYQKLQADSTKGFSKAALAARDQALAQYELAGAQERVNKQRDIDAQALQSYFKVSDAQIGKLREEADTYNLTSVALQKITATRALDKAASDAIYETRVNAEGVEERRLKVTAAVAEKILLQAESDKKATRVLVERVAAQKLIIQQDEEIARRRANGTVYLDEATRKLALLDQERDKRQKNLEQFREDSEERRRLVAQDVELYQTGLDSIRADKLREVWQSVDQIAHQTFTNIFEGGQDVFTKLRDTLKSTLLDLLYQMTVRKWVFNFVAAVTGNGDLVNATQQSVFGGKSGGSGLIGDIANGKSVYDIASGGFAGVGSSISTVGNLVGSASLSAYGAGMGLTSAAATEAAAAYTAAAAEIAASNAALAATYTEVAGSLTAGAATTAGASSALAAIPGWGWAALALSTQLGGPQIDKVGSGLSGSLSAKGSSLSAYDVYKEDHHGLFGIGAFTTENRSYRAADASVSDYVNAAVTTVTAATKGYAAAIGLSADAVDGFTKSIDLSLEGLNADQRKEAIDKAISGFVDDMVSAAFGSSLQALAKEGETSSTTLQRLAVDLTSVNAVFDTLGYSLMGIGTAGATAAEGLLKAFGGLQSFQAQTSQMYQAFYSKDEQKAATVRSVLDSLTSVGITTSASDLSGADKATWRTVLDAFSKNAGTDQGAQQYAAIVKAANALSPYFDNQTVVSAAPSVSDSVSASPVSSSVPAADNSALKAWQAATDAIVRAMGDLRSTLLGNGVDSFAKLQAQFAIEVAQAKAGDLAAAQDLPTLAKSLVDAGKAFNTTSVSQALLIARVTDALGSVVGVSNLGATISIPKFADGGFHSGGLAMVGEQGPELVNLPPARVFNANDTVAMLGGGANQAMLDELRALRAEVAALRGSAQATAVATRSTAATLAASVNGGQPIGTRAIA